MIIDCHGHFTTEPRAFHDARTRQVAYARGETQVKPVFDHLSDEELTRIIEDNQLRLQRERGADLTILSPRASGMGHHLPHQGVANEWARTSNDVISRICGLFPANFAAVGQLPQTARGDLGPVIDELERCVDLGFVGFNVNPDPSGGAWDTPPLHDNSWDPLWEAMTRLDVPAMVHVSSSCTPAVHTTGAHYLSADTNVFMQLVEGDLFGRHPALRLVIPHGGGAAPYHWGRFRGLAMMLGKPPLEQHLMGNVFFDTCVYHQPGIDLLFQVIATDNIVFGSELLGAVRTDDPETGHPFDDTLRYVDQVALDPEVRAAVLGGNARRIYPRLDAQLVAQGR